LLAQRAYRGLVQFAPAVWGSVYACLDASPALGNRLSAFAGLRQSSVAAETSIGEDAIRFSHSPAPYCGWAGDAISSGDTCEES